MPNAKVLSEKQAIVEALAKRIQNAGAGVIVDYRGITVAEDTELRAELRKDNVEYSVVKNTLTRKAMDKLGMSGLDEVLNGTTSLATAEKDPIAPFRIIADYSKKLGDRFNVKQGPGRRRDRDDVHSRLQGRAVFQGPGYHDRTHHRPGRLPRSDSRAEGRLRRSPRRSRMIGSQKE